MRGSVRDVTGNVGETEVSAEFERLNWGVAPNPRHDLGTDLWLMARDERVHDLGLVVGAQVKSGPSWFRHKERSGSEVIGWWFRDPSRKHIDAWLSHSLPHLIVLRDLDSRTSYWAFVTEQTVVSTGKGAKVLVRASHTIDEAHRSDLLEVAASQRAGGRWEGSAWTAPGELTPSAAFRHALIVPRLVAPHPNAGIADAITPVQAVALLVQGRLADLGRYSEMYSAVPSLTSCLSHPDWDWQLVGALGVRLTVGHLDALAAAIHSAPDTARLAAAVSAYATCSVENGRPDAGLSILKTALSNDDMDPVDHLWLVVQAARACIEVGRTDEARDLAIKAQAVSVAFRNDVTATALAGAAALILFNTAALPGGDVSELISSSDTAARWWRAQTVSAGLTELANETFRDWSSDQSMHWSTSDAVTDHLQSAALTASFAGEQSAWRHLSGLFGQSRLLRTTRWSSPQDCAEALTSLRLSGNTSAIANAARHFANNGPCEAVTLALSNLELDSLTRTTAVASLALIEEGGDLVDAATADCIVSWLLKTLHDPSTFRKRTTSTYMLEPKLADALAGVVASSSPESQQAVTEHFSRLPGLSDQVIASAWNRVIAKLPRDAWNEQTLRLASQCANEHHFVLSFAVMGLTSEISDELADRLQNAAAQGNPYALSGIKNAGSLGMPAAQKAIIALSAHVRSQISAAERGSWGVGGPDYGQLLAILNVAYPAASDWDTVVDLLTHPATAPAHKNGAMGYLASVVDSIGFDIRARLLVAARAAADQEAMPAFGMLGGSQDSVGVGAELIDALVENRLDLEIDRTLALLAGGDDDRIAAARIASRSEGSAGVGTLLVLATDESPRVRASAAYGLARYAAEDPADNRLQVAVKRAAGDTGRLAPRAVADALAGRPLSSTLSQLGMALRNHRSAWVRRSAASVQ